MSILDVFKSKEPVDMFVVKRAVDSLKNELYKRNKKIEEKITGLQEESDEVKNSIDELMRDLVNCAMEDDAKGQAEVNSKIAKLRPKYDDLLALVKAYIEAMHDTTIIQSGVGKVIELARKQKDIIHETRVKMINTRARIEQEIKSMQDEVKLLNQEINRLNTTVIDDQLAPLVKYIEPRVQSGSEARYMHHILSGQSDESQLQHCFKVIHDAPVESNVTYMGLSYEERALE